MKPILFTVLLLGAYTIAGAQQISKETYLVCGDKVFTQVETLPGFKNGIGAFEDSLTQALKRKDSLPPKGSVTYRLVVTMQSQLVDVKAVEGEVANEETVRKVLKATTGMWLPAKQNGHTVCAYVYLTIGFSKSRLEANLFQKEGE